MKAKIQFVDLPQFAKRLQALGPAGFRAGVGALYREAERVMADSKEHYVPVDMGALRSAGFVLPPEVEGDRASITMGYGGAASEYALYVHEGIGPAVGQPAFMPPVDPIRAWARRHGIDEALAFPIARAIGQRGIKPVKYLEKPLNAARRGMDRRLAGDVEAQVSKG